MILYSFYFANWSQKSGRCKVQLNSVCKFICMKIICSQEEHICNWWLSISIYTSVLSSDYFHWVTKTTTVTLISNFKTNKPTIVSFFYFLSFCLFLFLSHFPSTILHYSNATEVKHWSSWASWQDVFSKKTKCLWKGLMCQNKCTCKRVLVVMSFEWSRCISLMGRLCFLILCILEGPGFARDTGEALPTGHSKMAAAGACLLSKSSFCWKAGNFNYSF